MSAPQIGDVIATAEEWEDLPVGAAAVGSTGGVWVRSSDIYLARSSTGAAYTASGHLMSRAGPLTLVYLPGRPPRPEWVVKAEALRAVQKVMDDADGRYGADAGVLSTDELRTAIEEEK